MGPKGMPLTQCARSEKFCMLAVTRTLVLALFYKSPGIVCILYAIAQLYPPPPLSFPPPPLSFPTPCRSPGGGGGGWGNVTWQPSPMGWWGSVFPGVGNDKGGGGTLNA